MESLWDTIKTEFIFFWATRKIRQNKIQEARALLQLAMSRAPSHKGILLQMGHVQILMREFEDCKNTLFQVQANFGENPVIHLYSGIIGLYQNNLEEAQASFKRSIEIEPQNNLVKNYLSLCSILRGEVQKGLQEIKNDGIYSNPRFVGFLMTAIENILKSHDHQKQTSDTIDRKITQPQQGSDTPQNLADNDDGTGGLVKLDESMKKNDKEGADGKTQSLKVTNQKKNLLVILFSPLLGIYYWFLGTHYLNRGKFSEAVKALSRVLQLSPDTQQARIHLGEAYFYQEMYDEAFEHFEISNKEYGENPEIHYYLGRIYQEKGNLDKAEEHLLYALRLFPKLPEALYSIGQIALSRGDMNRAQDYFIQSAEYDYSYLLERINTLEKKLEKT